MNETLHLAPVALQAVKPFKVLDGVEVFGVIDIHYAHFGKGTLLTIDPDEFQSVLCRWMNAVDAHYYAAEKEDFSVWKGVIEAQEAGKRRVVVEDLS